MEELVKIIERHGWRVTLADADRALITAVDALQWYSIDLHYKTMKVCVRQEVQAPKWLEHVSLRQLEILLEEPTDVRI